MATTSLPSVSDWFVEETTSSSVTLAIQFDEDAHPDDTGWEWFFYRKSTSNTGTYKKSLSWKKITSGGIYYTITITGLSANTAYVGRLTDNGHNTHSAVLFEWTTAKEVVPDPYVSSVVSDAAGELTITVANRNDKAVVFKWAPPVNSSLAITKASSAWQDSFTFDNCYYGQKCFGGAEITGYTISSKSATVKGTCTCSYSQNDLTITFSTDDDGNYPEWSLDDTNWYSTSTSISKTFSAYGWTSQEIYFRATKNGKVLTEDYSITKQVNIKAPSIYTVSVSMATVGIQQYKVDYTDEDGNQLTNQTYSASHTFTVKAGGDFKIADVTYATGYEESGDGKGKSFSAIKENKSVSLGAKKKTFTVTFSHRDYDNTDTVLDTTTKSYEYGTYAYITDLTTSFSGYSRKGWNSSNTATTETNSYLITQAKIIYVFYENPALELSVSSNLSNSSITATVKNGVANYTYQIKPGSADSDYDYKESTTSSTSKTWLNLPRGQTYYIKVTDSDHWKTNHESDAISGYSHLANYGPSISYSSATLDTETGKYKVTFTLDLGGYTSAKIIDFDSTYSSSTTRTITCDYTQTSVSAKFYYNWEGTALYSGEKTCTFSLTKPYQYSYESQAYYWDGSVYGLIETGQGYSQEQRIIRPQYEDYPGYLGYVSRVNGNESSSTSTAVALNSNYSTHITWRYRKDAYPYILEQWYYDDTGALIQYKGPNNQKPPYNYPYNTDSLISISGNLTGKGTLEYYQINNNTISGNGSSVQTIDLSDYKNTQVTIKACYYLNLSWINSPYFVSGTNKLRASWTGGRAGYRFEYFTDYTHHYYPGQDGLVNITSYPPNTSNDYNLPGGYHWDILLTDRADKTLTKTIYSSIIPLETNDDIQLEFTDAAINLKATVSAFYQTGYNAVRLEYKRATDTNWTIATSSLTSAATTLLFNLENDIRLNENDNVIYHTRLVWYDSNCDTTAYSYEYKTSTKIFYLGYKTTLVIQDRIKSLNVSYTTITNDYYENKELTGGTTHTIWLQYQSNLRIDSYIANFGYYGPEFDINVGSAVEIISAETYEFNLVNQTELYRVTLECGKNISRYTIKYYDYVKSNTLGTYTQEELTIEAGTPQTIETPITHSNIVLISWANDEYNTNMFNEATLSPIPRLVTGEKTYDASQFHLQTLSLSIDFYTTTFTLSSYIKSCSIYLADENNIYATEIIQLSTGESDSIYFYNFSPTMPYHTHFGISNYTLIEGRKNIYIKEEGLSGSKLYLKNYTNGIIPIERGKNYIISADSYILPILEVIPDKYSVTCNFSAIDSEIFMGSPHEVIFTQTSSNTTLTEYIDFSNQTSLTFTYTIKDNKYTIFADSEFSIVVKLYDAQSSSWLTQTLNYTGSTLKRLSPSGLYIKEGVSNRAYGYVTDYEDYSKVSSYYWNTTTSSSGATSINVINNLTENVITSPMPSGDQPFDLDSTYYAQIVLSATDGSGVIWMSGWGTIETPNAYSITFILNNINSIKAKSDITNNKDQIFTNGQLLTVTPNASYTISNINNYNTLTTPNNRTMTYKAPVFYTISDGRSGTFVNTAGTVTPITGTLSVPALTVTLTATPADWVWPNGYVASTTAEGITPVLTAGIPTTDFKHSVWNELMFYIKKWAEYKNKLEGWDMMTMSAGDTILTRERYNNAYGKLIQLFNALSAVIPSITEGAQIAVTAKGIQAFGDTIKYDNLK